VHVGKAATLRGHGVRFPTLRAFGELTDRAPIARPPEDRVIVIADDRPFEVPSVLAA
jgi:hypothetical protein